MLIQQIAATPSDEIFAVIDGALWRYGYPTPGVYVDPQTGACRSYPRQWTKVDLPRESIP